MYYVGSSGGGYPNYENGFFLTISAVGIHGYEGIVDGLSRTIAMTEAITYSAGSPGDPNVIKRGAIRKTRHEYLVPDQLESLIADCVTGQTDPTRYSLGNDWKNGSLGVTRLIHILPPNSPSCNNNTRIRLGVYAPSSNHGRGVNALFGDGAVHFVSSSIDRNTWAALGTRHGGENTPGF